MFLMVTNLPIFSSLQVPTPLGHTTPSQCSPWGWHSVWCHSNWRALVSQDKSLHQVQEWGARERKVRGSICYTLLESDWLAHSISKWSCSVELDKHGTFSLGREPRLSARGARPPACDSTKRTCAHAITAKGSFLLQSPALALQLRYPGIKLLPTVLISFPDYNSGNRVVWDRERDYTM